MLTYRKSRRAVRNIAGCNRNSNVATYHIYDSFGKVTSQTQLGGTAVDCLFGYTGKAFDRAKGLQNNLNRWYDPSVGTWLSEDPAAADENLYRYAGNGPTDGMDPSGRWTIGCNIIGFMTMPIHERLTVLAALDAGYKAKGYEPGAAIDGNTPSIWCLDDFKIQLSEDPFFLGLVDGRRAVDAPNGLVQLGYCCSDVEKENRSRPKRSTRPRSARISDSTRTSTGWSRTRSSLRREVSAVGAAAIQRKMVDWISVSTKRAA